MEPDEIDPAATGANPPNPTPAKPVNPGRPSTGPIQLTDAEYQRLLAIQSERDALAAERRAADEKAEGERLKLLAEKGQFEEALRLHQQRAADDLRKAAAERDEVQKRYLDREKSLVVNDATAGATFISDFAARQARQLLESKFDVVVDPATNAAQVVDKTTRRPASDVAKEWLSSAEAAHFLAPKGKGGSPSQPGNTQTDAGNPDVPDELSLTYEQRVMRAFRDGQQAQAASGWQLGVAQQARLRNAQSN